jgi:hypothetical protein
MARFSAVIVAVLAIASVVSAIGVLRHDHPITAVDVNGERLTQYIVVLSSNANKVTTVHPNLHSFRPINSLLSYHIIHIY